METQDARHLAPNSGPELSNALAPTDQTVDQTPGREAWRQEPPNLSAPPRSFRILESTADGRRVIAPCGELDLSNAAQLENRLAGSVDTILDLSELSFIDSTGISVVVTTAQRAHSEGWEFSVQNPRPAVLRVFKLVALDRHLGLGNPAS
jgi:anti-sigma B factor antagonist